MSNLRSLPPVAALALLLAGPASAAEEPPHLLPTRDVDITYDVSRPLQPKIRQRVRWLAGDHLERVDGPDKSTTIFDRNAHEITLLTPKSRAYRKLEGTPRRPLEPEPGAVLKRGNEFDRCRTAMHRLVMDGRRRNPHGMRDRRRRVAASRRRRPDRCRGPLGELRPPGSGAFSSTAGLCAGARPGRRRDALR